jgi:hypothetical protein
MCAVRCFAPYPRTLNRNRANKGDGCDGERKPAGGAGTTGASPKGMPLVFSCGFPRLHREADCCSKGMLACCISTCCRSSSWHSLRAVDGACSNEKPSKQPGRVATAGLNGCAHHMTALSFDSPGWSALPDNVLRIIRGSTEARR